MTDEQVTIGDPSSVVSTVKRRIAACDRLQLPLVSQIGLGDDEDGASDPEEMKDVQVFDGLRHHAIVGRDREQHQVDAVGAGEHVADETLVPRDVDHARAPAAWQFKRRKAQIDRNAARLLFLEPVGILTGEGLDEGGLAVVDVPGGADDPVHEVLPRSVSHESVSAADQRGIRSSPSKMVRKSSRKRPSRIRPMIGGRAARKRAASRSADSTRLSTAMTFVGNSSIGRAPLPTCDVESSSATWKSSPRRQL